MSDLEWPAVQPILGTSDPTPFPTMTALPDWLRRFAAAQAASTEVPEDTTALLGLATVSAALQGRLAVRAGEWVEPITLYTAIVMNSGERKSSIFSSVTKPLRELEDVLYERDRQPIAESQAAEKMLEIEVETLLKAITKQTNAARNIRLEAGANSDAYRKEMADLSVLEAELVEARDKLNTFVKRHKTQIIADDVTPEACAQVLHQQRHSAVAVMSSEGGPFEVLSGVRYSDAANLDVFLKGHSGDSVKINRVGRDSEIIPRAMLTLGLMIQPNVLEELGQKKSFTGRGLLARFAYSIPMSRLGHREVMTEPVSEAIRKEYHDSIVEIGLSAYDATEVREARMSDEAYKKFVAFQKDVVEGLFRDGHPDLGDLETMADWIGKLAGLVLRVSALHAAARARGLPTLLDEDDVDAGISTYEYFLDHAYRAYSLMGQVPDASLQRQMLLFFKERGLERFRISELQQKWRVARALKAERIDEVLQGLQDRHYVRRYEASAKPARYYWRVNPMVHGLKDEDVTAPVLVEEKSDA